ncbi:hypothetical protein KBC86_00595 [Candidatus Gracilibacteria bacterium]|nr:hypothetical protein [Candidatus Gracilibacteria bacterium]
MTLGDVLPLFAEFWDETGRGLRAPSFASHRNLYELWRLWTACKTTLVSDVFELHGRAISLKVAKAAGTNSRIQIPIHIGFCRNHLDTPLTSVVVGGDPISAPIPGGFRFFMRNTLSIRKLREKIRGEDFAKNVKQCYDGAI